MKISKIFAAMSAAALAASMVALPASAEESSAETVTAYNIGFNIQFGHFYGGTITATVNGSNVLGMSTNEEGALTCTGEKVDSQTMWVVNDWSSTVSNTFVENIAIADGTYDESNPGWNGMWIQCYVSDLSGLEITFEVNAEDGTWKDMDPTSEDFSGWSVIVPAIEGVDPFICTDAAEGTNQPAQKSFTYTLSLTADELAAAAGVDGNTKPQIAEEEITVGDGGDGSTTDSNDSTSGSSADSSSTASSGSSSTGSSSTGTTSKSSGTTSKSSGTTSTTTTSSSTSDNVENTESGAAAGVGLAIAALAGAAIVVSRKK